MNRDEVAIKVENLSKTFRIPHEKITTLKGAFVNVLKRKSYEEFKALDDISFEVKKGEFFGIIGRNGSGKSTLLKILAGVYKPDEGSVKVDGLISPFLELGIGFNEELSGRDNIYLNAAVLGLSKKQIDEKFDDIVEFSELRRFIDQKIKNYSSGMQVRLAFSVAIHANRDILLMDEVLAVGDVNFQRKCLEMFRTLKNSGKTIVFVSHDLENVRKFCDRVLFINNSKKIVLANAENATYVYIEMMKKERDENYPSSEKTKDQEIQTESAKKIVRTPQIILSKDRLALIKQVRIVNNLTEKKPVSSIRIGDDIFVEVEAEISEACKEDCAMGILIEDIEENYVFGSNTVNDHLVLDSQSNGKTKYVHLKNIALIPKTYFLTVTLYDRNTDHIHMRIKKSLKFEVFDDKKIDYNRYQGKAYIDHEWLIE